MASGLQGLRFRDGLALAAVRVRVQGAQDAGFG